MPAGGNGRFYTQVAEHYEEVVKHATKMQASIVDAIGALHDGDPDKALSILTEMTGKIDDRWIALFEAAESLCDDVGRKNATHPAGVTKPKDLKVTPRFVLALHNATQDLRNGGEV